jgi:S-adenosylmethionine hydrolase
MSDPLVTLTTDFGTDSPYVAAMKGIILSRCPDARIIDLSHDIPPQNVRHAAFFLPEAIHWFPDDTLHVVVVDPGVGTDRAILYVEHAGKRLLVPDNGCWTWVRREQTPARVLRVTNSRYWLPGVSSTFHGRDIFAPVAGELCRGLDPVQLGPPVTEWVRLPWPEPRTEGDTCRGEVLFVDHFGNLITNVPGQSLPRWPVRVQVSGQEIIRCVSSYGQAAPGELVVLMSSRSLLEVAQAQGSAARTLDVGVGAPVLVIGASDRQAPAG